MVHKRKLLAVLVSLFLLVGLLTGALVRADSTEDALKVATEGILDNGLNGIHIDIYGKAYKDHANQTTVAYQRTGCTWFAASRASELTGRNIPIYSGVNWWKSGAKAQGFKTGQTARAKALACFSGHVAVVERVDGKVMTVSEGSNASASDPEHGYCVIRETTVDLFELSNYKGQEFYGYVYLGVGDSFNTAGDEDYYNEHYSWVDEYLGRDNMPTADTSPANKKEYTIAKGSKDGIWHAYKNDIVQRSYTGVLKNAKGAWYYVKNGDVAWDYTGFGKNLQTGVWWRVVGGRVDFGANEIYKNPDNGVWYKTTGGKVTFKETGVFKNDRGWWRVVNSRVDFGANGIYKNAKGWWKTTGGKVTFKENGIFKNENGRWKVKNSGVDFGYSGKFTWNGKTYNIKNGKVI